jgi:hypothetical protein
MTLSEEARDRLADVVALQPTKNGELIERWGMDSGSEVHQYLESEFGDLYYRDDDGLIRATDEAADLVDVEPGVTDEDDDGVPDRIRVPRLQAQVYGVIAGPDERSQSVVSVLHDLRDAHGVDPSADDVRAAIRGLRRKDVVETIYRTVPTYRLSVERDAVDVEVADEATLRG